MNTRFGKRTVVLGNFDGVHLGHRALIDRARALGGTVTAYTFLSLPGAGACLTDPDEKRTLLVGAGADSVFLEEFERVRDFSPERFVREVLAGELHASDLVCGFNFRFGKGGAGDAALLTSLAAAQGMRTFTVPAVLSEGEPVSSTRVRALLRAGKPEEAEKLLGRPYSFTLPVLHGKALGRTLGFPTANQTFPEGRLVPKTGVYASFAEVGGELLPALTNIGVRPTFENGAVPNAETHILGGWRGDLYGKKLRVGLLSYLREEKRFETADALTAEIGKNREEALSAFAAAFSEKGNL